MAALPVSWKEWVALNLLKGCDTKEILSILLNNGFTLGQSQKALGDFFPTDHGCPRDSAFYEQMTRPRLVQNMEKNSAVYVEKDKAQLIKLDNFLTPEECAEIVKLAKSKLRPSEITNPEAFYQFRTSSTCDLPDLKHTSADALEQKIIQTLGVDVGTDEIIQAQHYSVGQEFKAHTDYFEPGDKYVKYASNHGQRTWTFMVYLNSECEGGETEFVNLGLKFKPQTGTAIIWNNLYADGTPNPDTIHHAHPIISGEKAIITKWFRDRNKTA